MEIDPNLKKEWEAKLKEEGLGVKKRKKLHVSLHQEDHFENSSRNYHEQRMPAEHYLKEMFPKKLLDIYITLSPEEQQIVLYRVREGRSKGGDPLVLVQDALAILKGFCQMQELDVSQWHLDRKLPPTGKNSEDKKLDEELKRVISEKQIDEFIEDMEKMKKPLDKE